MRLLIYGGSFNPPHLGHTDALRAASEFLRPDAVLVIPAGEPPHKALQAGSPTAAARLSLCRLAFGELAETDVSDMELLREGKSYTVETLETLAGRDPGGELFFLMGTDMLLYMEQWHCFQRIFQLCTLAVLTRNAGEDEELTRYAHELRVRYGARIVIVPKTPLAASSTDLRRRLPLREGRELLSDPVYGEIIRRRLYAAKPELGWLWEHVRGELKPSRVPHVRGCEETAARLARRWGADEGDAAEAGILHDITKRLLPPEQLRLCEKYGIILDAVEREQPALLHALTGAWVARERFGVSPAVFSAIRWHTTGCADMTLLDKILYLADFIEPGRSFEGVDAVRELAFTDLNGAMVKALRMSMEEVRRRGVEPHGRTAEALRRLQETTDRGQ